MDEPTPQSGVTPDGLKTWAARLADIMKAAGSADKFAEKAGLPGSNPGRTIRGHIANPPVPTLEIIARYATHSDYSALEQIRDLFGLPEDALPINATTIEWRKKSDADHILAALQRALFEVRSDPSVPDLAEMLLASCAKDGEPARWRSRIYDASGGYHFRHTAFHIIQFDRWFGPFRTWEEDPFPDKAEAFLKYAIRQDAVGKRPVPSPFLKEEPPARFLLWGVPGEKIQRDRDGRPVHVTVDPATRKKWWDRTRTERCEIMYRIGDARFAMRGEWEGAYGRFILPLHGGTREDLEQGHAPRPRHILVEPACPPPVGPGRNSVPKALNDGTEATTIVLISPVGSGGPRIADHLAQSLGWFPLTARDLGQRLHGRRPVFSDPEAADDHQKMVEFLAKDPPKHHVIWLNARYLMDPANPHRLRTGVLDALNHPDVQPIFINPTNESLRRWEMRATPEADDPTPTDTPRIRDAAANRKAADDFQDEVTYKVPGLITAKMHPTIPWDGDCMYPPGAFAPAWFRHPVIGDIEVRAAYELTRCIQGVNPDKIPMLAPGSVLHKFGRELNACTSPEEPWTTDDIPDTFDFHYYELGDPKDAPPGRTFTLTRQKRPRQPVNRNRQPPARRRR